MKTILSLIWRSLKFFANVIGIGGRAFIALVGICGVIAAVANYTMTQGSGTTFGSIVVSTVHYVQMLTCDPTTPSQCAAVDSSGNQSVKVTNTNANGSATSANSSPVVIASDQAAVAVKAASSAFVAGSIADLAHGQGTMAASVPVAIASNQSAIPVNTSDSAGTGYLADPCESVAPTYTPINISASGSTKIISGTSAKKTYICDIHLVTNAANNVALIEGTVTNCGSTTAGMAGGTTAATGWNFGTNGGIALGSGGKAVIASATAADDVCLIVSASTQLSGHVKWVQK